MVSDIRSVWFNERLYTVLEVVRTSGDNTMKETEGLEE